MQVEWRQQVQACKMAAGCGGSGRWSRGGVGKEEGDLLRTVDSLRGRLQAERVASRVAREESDISANRVAELERLMAIEISARDRAERMLKSALKKLQALKLPDLSGISVSTLGDSSSDSVSCLGAAGEEELSSQAEDFRQSLSQEASWSSAGSADSALVKIRPREDVESKAPVDGEITGDDFTRQSSIGSKVKDQNIREIDDVDVSPASASSSFRLDNREEPPSVCQQVLHVEKTRTEVEKTLQRANGSWAIMQTMFSFR